MHYKSVFQEQQYFHNNSLQLSIDERISLLKKIKKEILKQQDAIISALDKDFKKPSIETELTEIFPVIQEINHICKKLKSWAKKEKVKTPISLFPSRSHIYKEPKGVVLIISPWNYPFQLALSPLIISIAAGNSNILKPSEVTPNTSAIIEKIVHATCPKSVAKVFTGGIETSKKLLELPFNHIFFTGGTNIGKLIMAAASKHLSSLTLELGGKSPAIIDESADISNTVEKLLWGKCLNAGQTCVAPDYIYVHKEKKEELYAQLKIQLEKFYPNDKHKDLAQIINPKNFQNLVRKLEQSLDAGAKLLIGTKSDNDSLFFSPIVLIDVNWEHSIMEEEIFGPILPILVYEDLEKTMEEIMLKPRPLALYIFSTHRKNIKAILQNTRSGGVCINQTAIHLANPYLPFGGVGESGIGAYHGKFGFDELSHRKAVLVGSKWNLIKIFYPPYTPRLQKFLNYFKKLFY